MHRCGFGLAPVRHVAVARIGRHHADEVRALINLGHLVRRLLARASNAFRALPRRPTAIPGVPVAHARRSRVVARQASEVGVGGRERRTRLNLPGPTRTRIGGAACCRERQRARLPLAEQRLFQGPVLVGVAPIAIAVPLRHVRAVALPAALQVEGAARAFGHDHMVARAQVMQPERLVPAARAAPEVHVVAVVPVIAGHIGEKRRLARVHGHEARAALGAREHEPVLVRVVRRAPAYDVGPVRRASPGGVETQVGRSLGAQGDDPALPRAVVDERMVRDQLRCLGRGVDAVGAVGRVAPGAHPGPRPPVPGLPCHAQAVRGIGTLEPCAIVRGVVKAARGGQPDPRPVAHERVDVRVGVIGEPGGRPHPAVRVVRGHAHFQEQLGHAPDGGVAALREPHLAVAGIPPAPVVAEMGSGVRSRSGAPPAATPHAAPGQTRRQQERKRRRTP